LGVVVCWDLFRYAFATKLSTRSARFHRFENMLNRHQLCITSMRGFNQAQSSAS